MGVLREAPTGLLFLGADAVLAAVLDGVAEVVVMDDLRTLVQVHVGDRAARLVGQPVQRVHPAVEWAADIANDVRLRHGDPLLLGRFPVSTDASWWGARNQPEFVPSSRTRVETGGQGSGKTNETGIRPVNP